MVITKNQLATVTKTINANNSYSVRNKNCSTFASKVWNSVSSVDVSPGKVIHTPSALADSIEEMYPYTCENNAIMPEKTVYDIAYHTSKGIVYSNPFSNEDEGGSSSSRSRSYAIERQERQPLTSFTEKEKAFLDTYHK